MKKNTILLTFYSIYLFSCSSPLKNSYSLDLDYVMHWEQIISSNYKYTFEEIQFNTIEREERDTFDKHRLLQSIKKVRQNDEYQQSKLKRMGDLKMSLLEGYLENVTKNISKFKVKTRASELLADINESTDSFKLNRHFIVFKAGIELIQRLDPECAYTKRLRQEYDYLEGRRAKVILENNQNFGIVAKGKLSEIPTQNRPNRELEKKVLSELFSPGISWESVVFTEPNWINPKDLVVRKQKVYILGKISSTGDCVALPFTLVQYASETGYQDKVKMAEPKLKMFFDCTALSKVNQDNGNVELPEAYTKDSNLESDFKLAYNKKANSGDQILQVIITSSKWVITKDINNRVLYRNRISAVVVKSNQSCFYQNMFFRQNYSNGTYGATFVESTYDKKLIDCKLCR